MLAFPNSNCEVFPMKNSSDSFSHILYIYTEKSTILLSLNVSLKTCWESAANIPLV